MSNQSDKNKIQEVFQHLTEAQENPDTIEGETLKSLNSLTEDFNLTDADPPTHEQLTLLAQAVPVPIGLKRIRDFYTVSERIAIGQRIITQFDKGDGVDDLLLKIIVNDPEATIKSETKRLLGDQIDPSAFISEEHRKIAEDNPDIFLEVMWKSTYEPLFYEWTMQLYLDPFMDLMVSQVSATKGIDPQKILAVLPEEIDKNFRRPVKRRTAPEVCQGVTLNINGMSIPLSKGHMGQRPKAKGFS